MNGQVHINTGGPVAWVTAHSECDRCHHFATQFGRCQVWYDTDWTCGRCGMWNFRAGPPFTDRQRALRVRREFVRWLLAGSPKLVLP